MMIAAMTPAEEVVVGEPAERDAQKGVRVAEVEADPISNSGMPGMPFGPLVRSGRCCRRG
jgi:hypothetical protein